MPQPSGYTITLDSDGYLVTHSYHGDLEGGFETRAAAEHFAQDHAADAAERAAQAETDELDAIRELINARGGYVAPGNVEGQARGRAIDRALAALDGLSSDLTDRRFVSAAHGRGAALVALTAEAA